MCNLAACCWFRSTLSQRSGRNGMCKRGVVSIFVFSLFSSWGGGKTNFGELRRGRHGDDSDEEKSQGKRKKARFRRYLHSWILGPFSGARIAPILQPFTWSSSKLSVQVEGRRRKLLDQVTEVSSHHIYRIQLQTWRKNRLLNSAEQHQTNTAKKAELNHSFLNLI